VTELADSRVALFENAAAWEAQGALARFRRALRRADQRVLDDLLAAVPALPGVTFLRDLCVEAALLAVLLDEQKDLIFIQEGLHATAALQTGDG